MPKINLYIEEILEHIASYLIHIGNIQDFVHTSLACKQFYGCMQRQLDRYDTHPFPFLFEFYLIMLDIFSVPRFLPVYFHRPQISRDMLPIPLVADFAEACFFLENLEWIENWEILTENSEGDAEFAKGLLENYFEVNIQIENK